MNPEAIFHHILATGQLYPKSTAEDAARLALPTLTPETLREANAALLGHLAGAKRGYPPDAPHKEMMENPHIAMLANMLVILNQPWLTRVVKDNLRRKHIHAPAEDYASQALVGNTALGGNAHGMLGAILGYDLEQGGIDAFTVYLKRSMGHALTETPKQIKNGVAVHSRSVGLPGPDEVAFSVLEDRGGDPPYLRAQNAELLEVVQKSIARLPKERRWVAEFIVGRILETGHRPSFEEVAHEHQPPLTKTRGGQLVESTMYLLAKDIARHNPQLAEAGINEWAAFKRIFDSYGGQRKVGVGV